MILNNLIYTNTSSNTTIINMHWIWNFIEVIYVSKYTNYMEWCSVLPSGGILVKYLNKFCFLSEIS